MKKPDWETLGESKSVVDISVCASCGATHRTYKYLYFPVRAEIQLWPDRSVRVQIVHAEHGIIDSQKISTQAADDLFLLAEKRCWNVEEVCLEILMDSPKVKLFREICMAAYERKTRCKHLGFLLEEPSEGKIVNLVGVKKPSFRIRSAALSTLKKAA